MNTFFCFCSVLLFSSLHLIAEERGELIFRDDFNRNESQEITDEPGNGWNTNSKGRAKNNKQVDLRDGAMYIYISPEANHAVSVAHPAEFTDGSVSLRFMLEDEQDILGLDFADLDCKTVHAGHLFVVRINPKLVTLQDLKTGSMDLAIYDGRKAKSLSKEQNDMLKGKQKIVQLPTFPGKWHNLLVTVEGSTLSATIDGKPAGSFSSEGISHPTKKTLRLAVPRNAVVDDIEIRRFK